MLILDLLSGKKVVRVVKDAGGKFIWKTFPRWPELNRVERPELLLEAIDHLGKQPSRRTGENRDNRVCRDAWYSRYIYITWGPFHLM
mgnify:CR=1 FL=1